MKILKGNQIKEWDQFTIAHEPISSLALMERAAMAFVDWWVDLGMGIGKDIHILCGNGNNGGDGLAIARLLHDRGYRISVHILRLAKSDSEDFDINLAKCLKLDNVPTAFLHNDIPEWGEGRIIIDALLGTGVSKKVDGFAAKIIDSVNAAENFVVSVDMPSGLPTEGIAEGPAIKADVVYSFMQPKLSFFHVENEIYVPSWVVGDIGLHPKFMADAETNYKWVDSALISSWYRPRSKFGHKGDYGHALVCGGHYGMTGAIMLSSHAALRSGAGRVTACLPKDLHTVVHAPIPEVMVTHPEKLMLPVNVSDLQSFTAIGIGPGMGKGPESVAFLRHVLMSSTQPLVIDADALNILSDHPDLMAMIPENSILTPHPGEFRRLFGPFLNSVQMFDKQKEVAQKHKLVIVLKGAYTRIAMPDGKVYINSTGNPGMATAGSGDVLTGIITALLAQGYSSERAAVTGVYLHGLSGDLALRDQSQESLCASDVIDNMGRAFRLLSQFEGY